MYQYSLFSTDSLMCEDTLIRKLETHADLALILLLGREGYLSMRGKKVNFENGILLAVQGNALVEYAFEPPKGGTVWIISAPNSSFSSYPLADIASHIESNVQAKGGLLTVIAEERELLHFATLMDLMLEEDRLRTYGSISIMNCLFEVILHMLNRILISNGDEKDESARKADGSILLVEQAKRIIHKEFAQDLKLENIARRSYVSAAHLSRIFRRFTGITFSDYLQETRIAYAKNLLLNSDELIADIAAASGFRSIPHFNMVFKKLCGTSPSKFRQSFREKSATE